MSIQQMLLARQPAPSGFPLTLPGLRGWWDASDATTITLTSGKVSQWRDKSSSARHAAQATAGLRPVVTAAAWNGLDVVTFSGGRMTWSAMPFAGNAFYFFVVASTTSNSILLGQASGSGYGLWILGGDLYSNLNGADQSIAALGANDGSQHIFGRNGSASSTDDALWYDASSGTFSTSDSTISGFGVNGDGLQANGGIAEVVVGDSALDATQVASLRAYLKTKWGTP